MTQIGKAQDPPPSYQSSDRLFTVKDAGEILGISPEAVRARLKRGTLHRETGEDGTVLVRLDADPSGNGNNGTTDGLDASHSSPARVEELREEVAFLREELRREREARVEEKRRHDTIVLQLAQRIPELEAPAVEAPAVEAPAAARGEHETASEHRAGGDTPESSQEPVQRRPWLYRFFFGP